jgi:hypothetical protein
MPEIDANRRHLVFWATLHPYILVLSAYKSGVPHASAAKVVWGHAPNVMCASASVSCSTNAFACARLVWEICSDIDHTYGFSQEPGIGLHTELDSLGTRLIDLSANVSASRTRQPLAKFEDLKLKQLPSRVRIL